MSYTFTATAANGARTSPVSAASNSVTPTAGGAAGGGSSGGGGGTPAGGGGGGSSTIAVTIDPKSQTVSPGGAATFTFTVTNSGGAYVSAAQVNDPAAPGCNRTGNDIPDLAFLAPGETLTWSCTLTVLSGSLTASAVTAPGPVVTAPDSAQVTVTAPAGAPLTPPTSPTTQAPTPNRSTVSSKGITRNGNAKANTLTGTAKNDTLNGGGGNDILNGKAGNDTLDGGPGKDTVYADKHDKIAKGCEIVHRT